ncbi:SAM-dependent methyltransferase [Actinoplanes sp. RD1]|uniref:SAM-dependent methyltransferase n=1 Tax=Actinoplanes sp. RD1 TaxID=3064538 RepID=UPI0027413FCC|nr:methyltransferase domain-containing protein [Actinoplanes sp. RD1]
MTTTQENPASSVIRSEFERRAQAHYETKKQDPINLLLGEEDGLYHHHYSVSDYDHSVLELPEPERDAAILAEMGRLEQEQVDLILDGLGDLTPESRVLDGGSGRGGTAFLVNRKFNCEVVGINFCAHHIETAERLAKDKFGVDDKVTFKFANMCDTGLPAGSFDAVYTNETTMYVDLDDAYAEFSRLLRPGGRYVCVDWPANDIVNADSASVKAIDKHYDCKIPKRSDHFKYLAKHGLVPVQVHDYTREAIPYWDLRQHSKLATGVEQPFLDAHRSNELNYIVIVAEKVR